MTKEESGKLVMIAAAALEEKKAENIEVIEIDEISPLADYFLIAHGNNTPQVKKIVKNVFERIRDRFNKARENVLSRITEKLQTKEEREQNVEKIKETAKESIKDKLARYSQQVKDYESSRDRNVTHSVNDITKRRDTSYER